MKQTWACQKVEHRGLLIVFYPEPTSPTSIFCHCAAKIFSVKSLLCSSKKHSIIQLIRGLSGCAYCTLLFFYVNQLTEEQILALAPDAPSLKSGKDLADAKKWLQFAYNDQALWGEIKGSGSKPYQTQIDLQQVAFKCSCPSRKFPCKHGLGLFLIFVRNPSLISKSESMPDWVSTWIEKRQEKAEKKQETAQEAPDPEKAAKQSKQKEKTQQKRAEKVEEGIEELRLWLKDLLRLGFLGLPEKGEAPWLKMASRMIDAQAPGLAAMLRRIGNIDFQASNAWQAQALHEVAELYLLMEAFRNREKLPAAQQEEIKSIIGFTLSQKELTEHPQVERLRDNWLVMSKEARKEEDLTIHKNWLYGEKSHRLALILNFSHKHAPFLNPLMPGTWLEAELAFYPTATAQRAAILLQGNYLDLKTEVQTLPHWQAFQQHLLQKRQANPWLPELPCQMHNLQLVPHAYQWWLKDETGAYMPLAQEIEESKLLQLMALAGGQGLDMALVYQPEGIQPLGVWQNGSYIAL